MDQQVAVDIGARTIKAVEGSRIPAGLTIRRTAVAHNPVPDFRSSILEEQRHRALSLFLTDLRKTAGVQAEEAVYTAADSDVIIHYFDIAEMPQEKRERDAGGLGRIQNC